MKLGTDAVQVGFPDNCRVCRWSEYKLIKRFGDQDDSMYL
jgi:hypothetical protein